MPQGPIELHEEFGDDGTAFTVLGTRFGVSRGGMIFPKAGVTPTPVENRAIDYTGLRLLRHQPRRRNDE